MRVRPGIFAATVGKQALDCWKLSLPQQKAELCPQVGGGPRGEGAENRANTERSRTGSWRKLIPGVMSEHLGSAMLGPPPVYFNFVIRTVPMFPKSYLS